MAANQIHNPSPPGRSRLSLSGTKDDGAILHFHPRPSKKVNVERLPKAFKALDLPDAEQVLKSILPDDFRREAKSRGFTLVECMEEAKILLRITDGAPERLMTDDQLAAFLAALNPDMEPYMLLVHFRMLLKARGRHAVRILRHDDDRFSGDGEDNHGQIQLPDSPSQPAQP